MASSNYKYHGATLTIANKKSDGAEVTFIPGQTYSIDPADFPRLVATKVLKPTT